MPLVAKGSKPKNPKISLEMSDDEDEVLADFSDNEEEEQPKSKGIVRVKKFDPLFDAADAKKMRDKFIDKRVDAIYAAKMKSTDKESDKMQVSDGFRLSSEFITTQVLESLPTGDVRFDMKTSVDKFGHRGIPRGKVIEISGAPEMMKSARAYDILADIQNDPRGAIIHIYETESKANARYVAAAGCDVNQIIIELPDYIEQVYYDMEKVMRMYVKERNASVAKYIKDAKKKNMTQYEFDELVFRARMSYPILAFLYDSVGNHVSMEQWQKTKAGKTTKTPGKHAQAHAEGFRSIKNLLGNTMAVFLVVNHTKVEMGGMASGWGEKKTTTFGGDHIKYMSDVRIEQRGGIGMGGPPSTMMKVTRQGEQVTIGKWLTVKFIKNSLIETSQQRVENTLFRYKFGVGFDLGVSYMIAMSEIGMVKGDLNLSAPGHKNKILLPGNKLIEVSFPDFHNMLLEQPKLKEELRGLIEDNANSKATMVRKDT